MRVDSVRVLDGYVRMVFVKLVLISGRCFLRLHDHDRALNAVREASVEGCVELEQRDYASSESGLQRKMFSSFVLT